MPPLLLRLSCLFSTMSLPPVSTIAVIPCRAAERESLLELKHSLDDPSNRLSSWVGKNCCGWQGVGCNNITAHVTKLDLRNKYYYDAMDEFALRGDISSASSLQSLQHLAHLDLSGNDFSGHTIPTFLGSFSRLTYLNLSYASFSGKVPEQLGNLSALRFLDLSYNYYFSDDSYDEPYRYLYVENPGWIARLISLRHLNMSKVNFGRMSSWFETLNALPHIQDIELAWCNLIGPLPHSPPHLNFTSLLTLNLAGNNINGTLPEWLYNMTTLESLSFSWNDISMHGSISRLTSLRTLDLSGNTISKNFLLSLSNLCNLQVLFLDNMPTKDELYYNLEKVFSECLKYSLEELHLGGNKLKGFFPIWLGNIKNLKHIDLSQNLLHGSLLVPLGSLTSLQYLDLSSNNLNGTVGESIGQLKNLIYLDLSCNSLSLSTIHLANLSSLKYLDITNNSLFTNDTNDWIPSFQLETLYMDACKIVPRPHFPKWLQTQTTLFSLSLSDNGIQGTIPSWFHFGGALTYLFPHLTSLDLSYNSLSGRLHVQMANMMPTLRELILSNNNFIGEIPQNFTKLRYLDVSNNLFSGHLPLQMANMMPDLERLYLSNNNFTGEIPKNFTKLQVLYLSNNNFTGEIPKNSTKLRALFLTNNLFSGHLNPTINNSLSNLQYLDLSMNKFTGSIPHSFCQMNYLHALWLSNNFLGELPNCWNSSSHAIIYDFSHNQIYGEIPNSICNLRMIQSLHLSYNYLSGRIPLCLQECSSLVILDAGHNNFTGIMPNWSRKSLPDLTSLSLRFNSLKGNIPELSHLPCLQILDLSNNDLSGSIPISFGNLSALKSSRMCSSRINYVAYDNLWLQIKGTEYKYGRSLELVTAIDLSNNDLSGYIPVELGNLHGLQNLNLSGNNLKGEIPKNISGMQSLEVLDLSRNNLSGTIPSTLADLNFLDKFNLSYNNLSGRIPIGRQLDTFDSYSYIGNKYLCGPPLIKKCTDDTSKGSLKEENKDGDDKKEIIWLFTSISLGFIIGFWGTWGTLILHKRWRIIYYCFIDNTINKLCTKMVVMIRRKCL